MFAKGDIMLNMNNDYVLAEGRNSILVMFLVYVCVFKDVCLSKMLSVKLYDRSM